MFDLSKPIPNEVVFASIGVILVIVGIGLLTVIYYKKKLKK